ncbi:protein NPC2 homolog [Cimex lectularius]|uniref:MD-2-related lipid-recognition domain-containing protein n=1 Tax=Cimex lectularius TaxID=79782 RepID=A0A8I6S5V6_CIMLE|nr:protein NPC2 homolog [Cimex lectularius]
MKTSIFLLIAVSFALIHAKIYRDCGSKTGILQSVEISHCNQTTMSWCPLRKGQSVDLHLKFQSLISTKHVKSVVHGILGNIPIPFVLPKSDGCVDSGLSCPLTLHKEYVYNATLPILSKYPKVSVTVQWELVDDDGNDIVCFKIPTRIV